MSKLSRQYEVVCQMIDLYHRHNDTYEDYEIDSLKAYVKARLFSCRYGEDKPFCSHCKTHCYRKNEREAIRRVMRFSGPRFIFYRPRLSLLHALGTFKFSIKKLAKK
ncbi:MAG: nitrous oxide-stimulated promoter family protein [Anaerococcus sp.]|nr:nitrous oxide-stimulated promoter family protein [Anaerococcus sp.]